MTDATGRGWRHVSPSSPNSTVRWWEPCTACGVVDEGFSGRTVCQDCAFLDTPEGEK